MDGVKRFVCRNKYPLLLAAAVTVVYLLPLLMMSLPKGHDIWFHMNRVQSLANELSLGNFPARIYNGISNGYGYAAPLFYCDWMLLLPALLVCAGASVLSAYTVFFVTCTFLTAFSMYFCAKLMFGKEKTAFITACLYVFSSYFFTDMFYRHACGEMQTFIFLPIVLAGIWSILFSDCKKWYLLGLGLCGVVISHALTSVATVLFLVLLCAFSLPKIIKSPKKLLYIAASAAVFFASSAAFFFPMLEQLQSTTFIATDGTSATAFGTLAKRAMPSLASLFVSFNTQLGYDPYIPNGIGLAVLVPIVPLIIYRKKLKDSHALLLLGLGLFALLLTSFIIPWDKLQDLVGGMQFPWRLMVFATLFLTLFAGCVLSKIEEEGLFPTVVCAVAVLAVFSFTAGMIPKYSQYMSYAVAGKQIEYNYGDNIGAGEFLPSGTNRYALSSQGDRAGSNNPMKTLDCERIGDTVTVVFSGNTEKGTFIEVPFLMYLGYNAVLDDGSGNLLPLEVTYGTNNIVRCIIPDGIGEGVITVRYAGTPTQHISFYVSVLTFAGFIGYFIALRTLRRKEKSAPTPCKSGTPPTQVGE